METLFLLQYFYLLDVESIFSLCYFTLYKRKTVKRISDKENIL